MPKMSIFPKCEEYGLCIRPCMRCGLTCCSTSETEIVLCQLTGRIAQLESMLSQKIGDWEADSANKLATIATLEKEVALLHDVEVHLQVCENNKKAYADICEQYKQENKRLKENKVYSCGNCLKLEKERDKAEAILNCATHTFRHKLKTCCVEAEILQLEEELKTAQEKKSAYWEEIKEGCKQQGATYERERIYELMNSLRRGRFEFNDEVKMVLDMMKDEITKVSK